MRKIIKKLAKTVSSRLFYLVLGIMLVIGVYAVQAVITAGNVNTGDSLTAARWNQIITDLNWLDSNKVESVSIDGGDCYDVPFGPWQDWKVCDTANNYVQVGIDIYYGASSIRCCKLVAN